MTKILITGGTGQVGRSLQQQQWPSRVSIIAPSRVDMNLSDANSIKTFLAETNGLNGIINCAAYTAVDKAESEPSLAHAINAHAVECLANFARENNIPIVQISTDYVFDGCKATPYVEDDQTAPLGVYGQSKLAGEQAVLVSSARAVILRSAWVVSDHGENFVKTMLRLSAERDELNVVNDQKGSPTSAADIAQALQCIIMRLMDDPNAPTGIYHFVNAGIASWCELAQFIFEQSSRTGCRIPIIHPISTKEYPTPASRPQNSALDTSRIVRDFDIHPRFWKLAVAEILDRLLLQQA